MAPQKLFQSRSSHSLALLLSHARSVPLVLSFAAPFVQKDPSCFLIPLSVQKGG